MSGALNALREAVVQQLRQAGVDAAAGMESARAPRRRAAAAAVSLSRVACGPGGFQDYLGVRTDPESGESREIYGRAAELTLAIDIFAPRDGGERICQEAAEAVAETLICRGAAGLPPLEVQAGRVEFLEKEGMYRLPIACRCGAWLAARMDGESQSFVDFEVRGRMR